jgi:hypothetical protein
MLPPLEAQIPERAKQERIMVQAIADEVISWTVKEGSDPVLRLRGGLELIAHRADARSKAWNRAMSLQQEKHWPVYVEFDAANRAIQLLLLCTPRQVDSVRPNDSGDITVVFYRAPSFYLLKKDRADFKAMLDLLEHAERTRDSLLVAVHPTTGEILHARADKAAR